MKSKFVLRVLFLSVLLACICSTALALYCTECGSSIDEGFKFCPYCGTQQAGGSASNEPAPEEEEYVFVEITNVSTTGAGYVKVEWRDPSDNGPYVVNYMSKLSDDFYADYDNSTQMWSIASDVTGNAASTNLLAPGQDYWIIVFDKDDNYYYYNYEAAPAVHFYEFGTDVGIQLKTRKGQSYNEVSSFSSSDIARNSSTVSYGAYIKLTYPQLARERLYECLVTITGPNGEVITQEVTEMSLMAGRSTTYWSFYSFDWYFNILMQYYETVPVGTYTWSMYYDGMYVNSQTFRITQ